MTPSAGRATLPTMTPEQRIAMSEQVISGWEHLGKPGGPIPDTMRMIGEELAALRKVAEAEPSLADRIAVVSERYGRMALRVKLSAN